MMRQLHRVSAGEVFVASGVYQYLRGGLPTGTVEYWSLHEQPGGAYFVRADRDGREDDGISVLAQMLIARERRPNPIERLDVYVYTPSCSAKGYYAFFDDYAQVGRIIDDGAREQQEYALEVGFGVNPGLMAAQMFVPALAERGGAQAVFMPALADEKDAVLLPTVMRCEAEALDNDAPDAAGGAIETRAYRLMCAQKPDARLWFDGQDVLRRYEAADGLRAELRRYSRRPPG